MYQLWITRSTESMGYVLDFSSLIIVQDRTYGPGMLESEVRSMIQGEVERAQEYYDMTTSATPEDSALAPAHSALLKFLEQHGAVMRALQHHWQCKLSAERSGYRQLENDAYLAAKREAKEALALRKAAREKFSQLVRDLAENDKELFERVNVRWQDPWREKEQT